MVQAPSLGRDMHIMYLGTSSHTPHLLLQSVSCSSIPGCYSGCLIILLVGVFSFWPCLVFVILVPVIPLVGLVSCC